jgi:translocation and assembly module TamB
MSRKARIWRNIGIAAAALVVVIFLTAIQIVRTGWFRDYVKAKIITATEDGTGGRVEIGSYTFDWIHMRSILTDFVIHGNEPPGAAPYLRASRIQLDLRLFTSIHHLLDVTYLAIDRPEANIIVFADGRTNVPTPKVKSTSNETPLETLVNLAVSHFELTNGLVVFGSQKQELNVRGSNLRAQLWYSIPNQGYQGQLSFQPLYVVSGRNAPVTFTVTLPLGFGRDRLDFHGASITTAQSSLLIDGSLENLKNPKISARLNGHVALADLKNAADLPLTIDGRTPAILDFDANTTMVANAIQVTGLRLGLGQSNLEASGTLRDLKNQGALQFKSRLDLGELGRLAMVTARPGGFVSLNGIATLNANNDYRITGSMQGKDVSFQNGSDRIGALGFTSGVTIDQHQIELKGLSVSAFGGQFNGNAALQDFSRYRLGGSLRNLNLRAAARALGQQQLPYDGTASGPVDAAGDLKGSNNVTAHARLSIAPGTQGVPVSGKINAAYGGPAGDVTLSDSYLALPHSRLTLNGSIKKQLNIDLVSTDLNDLLAAASLPSTPVTLNGGQVRFTGTVMGSISAPQIAGHLAASRFVVEGRRFDNLEADAAVSGSGATVRNGVLRRDVMLAQLSAAVGLRNWKAPPNSPLSADASIQNGDLADLIALAGQPNRDYSGMLNANLNVSGTIANPRGAATVQVMNGTIQGEVFDRAQVQVQLADQLVTIPSASIEAGAARVNLTAEYQHPRDSFTTGQIHGHIQSTQLDLAMLQGLQKKRPSTTGIAQLNADASGRLSQVTRGAAQGTEFQLTQLTADASIRGLRSEGQNYGDLTVNARTSGQTLSYNLTSDFAGSNIRASGNTQLTQDYPTTADVSLSNLPVEQALVLVRRSDIAVKGKVSGTAHLTGTTAKPEGNVDLNLTNAVVYDEPVDRMHARISYLALKIDVPQLEITAGPSRIDLTASYEHPSGDLQTGKLQFKVDSSRVDLARIKSVQTRRPGLSGALQIAATGAAQIRQAEPRVLLETLNAQAKASGIAAQGNNFGDATLTVTTAGGRVNFALDSNLAMATLHGQGNAVLTGDYPIDAQLTFTNLAWSHVQDLMGPANQPVSAFEAQADGNLTARGPIMKIDQLTAALQLTRLQLSTVAGASGKANGLLLQNQGPIAARLNRGVVEIQAAHLSGPQTDFQATGSIPLRGQAMDLNLNGNVNLALLKSFSQDIDSSGTLALKTTLRGTFNDPLVNGQAELHNGTVNYAGLPNGLANANGVVQFNGDAETFRDLTAESGGGKLTLGGFVALRNGVRFGLRVNGSKVRVRTQGVSIVANSNLNMTGTPENSTISGTVTIERVNYAAQADLGSILAAAAPPVQSTAPSPFLDNMKLDIRVQTTGATAVQSSLAENLQADADLRIRGTVTRPGMLGRVTFNEGQLVFFGSTYTVNSGTIGFFNPVRIEPVLELSLETKAKGVDVTLRVNGPIDNLTLSYTSDPPLQFQEIVSLLAAGTTPTSDPTLLAHQRSTPPQSFQQMGESAILSKALADPVAGRLQRVFGVSQLKIDPTFTSGSELPQAQLTLQQRVASNIMFTYVTALNNANAQTIRVEMTLNPQWSAMATRDQNGILSINLLYKRQLR